MLIFLVFLAVSDAIRTSLGPRGMDKMVNISFKLQLTKKSIFLKYKTPTIIR